MILSGKEASNALYEKLKLRIEKLQAKPKLAAILVGENPASLTYLKIKQKKLEELGLGFELIKLDINISEENILSEIQKLNNDSLVSGIIVQLPLPKRINEKKILDTISPSKDVDCLTSVNLGKFFAENNELMPATAKGVLRLLDFYNIALTGRKVCVIGRSNLVTKPLAIALTALDATVTVCHSKTMDLMAETQDADIVIAGIGKAKMLTKEYFKNGQTVIDIGTSIDQNNKLSGDVDFENVSQIVENITPVPGGVGPMTVYGLIENLVILCHHDYKELDDKLAHSRIAH